MGYIEGKDRNQVDLFPESLDEYVSENSAVRVIDVYVGQLDLEDLGFKRATNPSVGRPPYDPKDLLRLYLYGYTNRIRSSRRLEHEATRNIEVIWLLKKLRPDFKTIADFRKDNRKALKRVFKDFVRLCDEWDLFGKEMVAIDGTKFRASNSKKNNYNQKKLDRHIKRINNKIDKYLEELDENDEAESCDRTPSVEEIKKRIEELKNRRQRYEDLKDELEDSGESEISTTDPDARLMAHGNNVEVSYNVQTTVDAKHKLVTDFKVTNSPNDFGELDNMALRTKKLFGEKNFEVLADKGYYKAEDLKKCAANGITPYVGKQNHSSRTGYSQFYSNKFKYDPEKDIYTCPAGEVLRYHGARRTRDKGVIGHNYKNEQACQNCKLRQRCTTSKAGRSIFRHVDQDFLDRIDMQTQANSDKYRLRQTLVEHPFGTIKRGWGANHFLTRRKPSVNAEMSLTYLAYNLKRVINILGTEEVLRRLEERGKPVFA